MTHSHVAQAILIEALWGGARAQFCDINHSYVAHSHLSHDSFTRVTGNSASSVRRGSRAHFCYISHLYMAHSYVAHSHVSRDSCTRFQATLIGALGGVMCSFSGHFIRVFCVQRLDVSVLPCIVVCCSVLQLQLFLGPLHSWLRRRGISRVCVKGLDVSVLQCVAVCCSCSSFSSLYVRFFCIKRLDVTVVQCVAVCCSVLQLQLIFGTLYACLLRQEIRRERVAVCCSVLQSFGV